MMFILILRCWFVSFVCFSYLFKACTSVGVYARARVLPRLCRVRLALPSARSSFPGFFFSFLIIREHTALLYWAGSASLPGPGAQTGALKSLLSVRTFCKFRVRSERVQSLEPGPALVLMIVGVCLYTVKQLPMEDM